MNRATAALTAAAALLVLAACGARGDDSSSDTTQAPAPSESAAPTDSATETTAEPQGEMFGTMESPCGPAGEAGVPTVADGQNGGNPLRIGTATDKGAQVQPGLTIEMEDSAKAFVAWCNEQGGLRGLPIELVSLDGQLFNAPAAIEQACAEVFAMVGGGLVSDDTTFPQFHDCKMIDFAGYTVTTAKAMSNGMVQPIPNPSNEKPASWAIWARDNRAEDAQNVAIMYADYATTKQVAEQNKETLQLVGGFAEPTMIPYSPAGEANWAPFVQQLKDKGVTMLQFVGSPGNLVPLLRSMDELGYKPPTIIQDANFYDSSLTEAAGTLADGVIARTAYAPFEEADQFPGMASYLELMDTYNPTGKKAGLGLQGMSAWLLFMTAANQCLDENDNVLERECVLAAGKQVHEWSGGGLHTVTDPGANVPPKCGALVVVKDGQWTRLFPELGSADDNGDGWHCDGDEGIVTLTGDYGDVNAGVDPSRPN